MQFIILDIETNGFSPSKSVLSFSAIICSYEQNEFKVLKEYDRYYTYQEEIKEQSLKIHQLSKDFIEKNRISVSYPSAFKDDIEILNLLNSCPYIVGHHIQFDLRFLKQHLNFTPKKIFCTALGVKDTIKINNKGTYKIPSLKECIQFFYQGEDFFDYHKSLDDCYATLKIIKAFVKYENAKELLVFLNQK